MSTATPLITIEGDTDLVQSEEDVESLSMKYGLM